MSHFVHRSLQFLCTRRIRCHQIHFPIVLLTSLLLVASIVFLRFYMQQRFMSLQVGDSSANSSLLVPTKSTYKTINVTIIADHPQNVVGMIFMSRDAPRTIAIRKERMMPILSGPCQCSYNFNGADEAIFLLSGSVLNYTIKITSRTINDVTTCLANISIFDNKAAYSEVDFSSAIYRQTCLHSGGNKAVVLINRTALYYVRVSVPINVIINSTLVVTRVYYSTKGLTSPNGCGHLTANNPSCFIDPTDVNEHYILLVTGVATVYYTITAVALGERTFFILVLTLSMLILASFSTLLAWCFKIQEKPTCHDREKAISNEESMHGYTDSTTDHSGTKPLLSSDESDEISIKQHRESPTYFTDKGYETADASDANERTKRPRKYESESGYETGNPTQRPNKKPPHLQKLLDKMEDVIQRVKVLTVNSSGLIHHCSQYGVTLIIPEGAVQQSATVWFGACLFSDKFQFEGDYVPATPIVWVYIDCELVKQAELYLPHHIDIENMAEPHNQLLLLKASDESILKCGNIKFKYCTEHYVDIEPYVIKISLRHFCSLCIAHKSKSTHQKRYVMARIDERMVSHHDFDVHFCFLFERHDCKKTFESQYSGLSVQSYTSFTFARNGKLQLTCDPKNVPGWEYYYFGTRYEHITEDMIDFYKDLGLEEDDAYENLKKREEDKSYPPSFKLRFKYLESSFPPQRYRRMEVRLTGVKQPVISTIELDHTNIHDTADVLTPGPSPDEKDPHLAQVLAVLIADDILKQLWYPLGIALGFSFPFLSKTAVSFEDSKCIREVVIQWRVTHPKDPWETLATALDKIQLTDLSQKIRELVSDKAIQLLPEPDIFKMKEIIKSVLISNHAKLCDLRASLEEFKSQLYTLQLISAGLLLPQASIGDILSEFKTSLNFKKNVTEVQDHCKKFLIALKQVGGSHANAASVLYSEWTDAVNKQLEVPFDISYFEILC